MFRFSRVERVHTDPFGRRISKTLYDGSGAVSDKIYYHYSDEGLIGEYRVVGGGPVEVRTYGYKPGSTWGTDPLFMKENGQYFFYHNDHLGTPQKMTDINGAVVWSGIYKAFGECQVDASSTVVNNLRFPGQYFDAETGLHYNYHRYYDAETGRYLSEDPIGLDGGINLYGYVLDPVNAIDPLGLHPRPYRHNHTGKSDPSALGTTIPIIPGLVGSISYPKEYDELHPLKQDSVDFHELLHFKYGPLLSEKEVLKKEIEFIEKMLESLGPLDEDAKKILEEWRDQNIKIYEDDYQEEYKPPC